VSFEHVKLVIHSTRYTGVDKAVCIALADHIGADKADLGDFEVWPGIPTLCKLSGWQSTAVQKSLTRLTTEKDGFVEELSQGDGRRSTRYWLHFDRLNGCPPVASGSPAGDSPTSSGVTRDVTMTDARRNPGLRPTAPRVTQDVIEQRTEAEQEKKNGNDHSAGIRQQSLQTSSSTATATNSGLCPEPHRGFSPRSPRQDGLTNGGPAAAPPTPSSAAPSLYSPAVEKFVDILCLVQKELVPERTRKMLRPMTQTFCLAHHKDLFMMSHWAVWAWKVSDHWPHKIVDPRDFLKPRLMEKVAEQYDNYYDKRKDGKRPHDLFPSQDLLYQHWKNRILSEENDKWNGPTQAQIAEQKRRNGIPLSNADKYVLWKAEQGQPSDRYLKDPADLDEL
jgi:hypothetical protein